MKKLPPALAVFLFTLSNSLLCQDLIKGWGTFQLECDVARFYGDTNHVFLELYYGIRENALSYKRQSGQLVGAADVRYILRNDTGVVATKKWTVPHSVDDSS